MEQLTQAFNEVAALYGIAAFLAFANERFVELFIKPASTRLTARLGITTDATAYVALITGGLLAWFAGIDLVSPILEAVGVEPLVWWFGQGLSAVIVGGGSHFLHDVWPQGK